MTVKGIDVCFRPVSGGQEYDRDGLMEEKCCNKKRDGSAFESARATFFSCAYVAAYPRLAVSRIRGSLLGVSEILMSEDSMT